MPQLMKQCVNRFISSPCCLPRNSLNTDLELSDVSHSLTDASKFTASLAEVIKFNVADKQISSVTLFTF